MPFNSTTGIYTPPSGAENAQPSQVIRSSTWNSIFTDVSAALSSLGQQAWFKTPRTVSSGSFTVAATDSLILVTGNSPTITLPGGATKQGPVNIVGAAASVFSGNHAVLVVVGGETISGLASVTLTVNYQSVTLLPLSGGGYVLS